MSIVSVFLSHGSLLFIKTKKKSLWCSERLGCHYFAWKEVASWHLISELWGSSYLLGIICMCLSILATYLDLSY